MGAKSRRKGASGERELAAHLREWLPHLADAIRRTSPLQAGDGHAAGDVALPGFHVECKRQKRCNTKAALAQAIEAAPAALVPIAITRDDHGEWTVTMRLDDWVIGLLGKAGEA